MKIAVPTIMGNDCLNIQETSVCHSINANCHNNAKRIIEEKARIIKPSQKRPCFSPLNNTNQPNLQLTFIIIDILNLESRFNLQKRGSLREYSELFF